MNLAELTLDLVYVWGFICALPIAGYVIEAIFDTRGNNPRNTKRGK